MATEFATSVDYGLTLSKRIYYGKGSATSPPVMAPPVMKREQEGYLPEAVMVYAVVPDPEVVDNPDVPSYQPYVHGKCVPPALIPLHMHGVSMEADCCLDTAYVTVEGTWRVHCVTTSRKCDCRIAIPLGEQGSLLGVEVDIAGRLFHTKLITEEDAEFQENVAKTKPGGRFLKGQIYTFKIPQVDGGSTLSIKVSWSQKLTYEEGQLCLSVPFNFPGYVFPVGKKIFKREKIQLNVNSGLSAVIECKCTSHPLKEVSRGAGKASFLYEAQVPAWSSSDLKFSYTVSSDDLFGGILLQSPSLHDFDQRQMFCLSLFPGKSQSRKVFRKAVVFLVDISGSMRGDLLENAKNALLASFSNLSPEDSFNIIAFNGEIRLFSSSMELASKGAIQNATQWLNDNLIADGGTEILLPLKQALKLLSDTTESIPLIFLITDGTVEDERAICNEMKSYLTSTRAISPRICTFGIGSYCNHYFLQMLAQIGRGHYDSAYHPDFVEYRIQRLFSAASSVILADVTLDTSKHVDSLELFPSHVPDLSSGSPLIVSGRYTGTFPDYVKVSGTTAHMTNFAIDLKVQNAKDIQLDRLFARRQIDMLTARAWLSESKELEDKVAKMSIQTGFPSEYTHMLLLKSGKEPEPVLMQEILNKIDLLKKVDSSNQNIIFLGSLGVGFGNMKATADNTPPGFEESKSYEAADLLVKVASNCCGRLIDHCCCMCFIQTCSSVNKQCSIVLTQLCAALSCLECVNCCFELFECF
ncbi:von Willebrand factor A domain-containing protein DDB_G0292028-like isoform X1 [Pistacia vera]|uniref:von Willebrand factor A domain-containing protein DDB_G0292028-like isoform X1 n=1 Tax=Pistacia vera TaxID=55513 RepID=UPI001262E4D4|nr:von Willebrand factor A domain-containing protein DDB_G0292028-like isoform X1 [Pistacia vera]